VKRIFIPANVSLLLLLLFTISVMAQHSESNSSEDTCAKPIYNRKEVSRPAKITSKPEPIIPEEARAKQVKGRVILTAVLCRTSKVTDIVVVEGLPYGVTEKMIENAQHIKFIPAEKDGQPVSQEQRMEYVININ
jgi:Gram-negative bacterial TonB protein C-terminal